MVVKLKQYHRRNSSKSGRLLTNQVVILLLVVGVLLYLQGNKLIATVDHMTSLAKESQLDHHAAMQMTSPSRSSLPRHNVTSQSVQTLKQQMDFYYAANDKKLPGTKNEQARRLLSLLVQLQMVPTLPKVPVTRNLPFQHARKSKAQEKEDVFVYEHFYNEDTKKCHQFGTHMFESGALDGVLLSNTFLLEQYFQEKVILVEASPDNWQKLQVNARQLRPNSKIHHGALCPVGESSVCIAPDPRNVNASSMHKVNLRRPCSNPTPCFDFDESIHYSFLSLDIEGFELEFLKMRKPKADILMIEVIQWARNAHELSIPIQLVAYMVEIGYYLYEETIGFRNFLFLSQDFVDHCGDRLGWDH